MNELHPYVIIRAKDAGVFAGMLMVRNGSAVRMNLCFIR